MRQWWIGLARRERIAVLSAAALVVLAVLYSRASSRHGARARG